MLAAAQAGVRPIIATDAFLLVAPRMTALRRARRDALDRVRWLRGRRRGGTAETPTHVEVPAGWTIGPPDFVGVGAVGAATDWWDRLIGAHPDVSRAVGVPAEIHFFDSFWRGDFDPDAVARYHAWFPRPTGKRAGEWTPNYLADHWTPSLLRRAAPDARLLALLGDPVERFAADVTSRADRAPVRVAANGAFQRGLYADQLLRLFMAFPRDQVLVLQQERCVRDPTGELRRTFAFLGVAPDAADTIDPTPPSSPGQTATPVLTGHQRAILMARYAPENQRLAGLLPDLDLSLWPA